MLKKLARNFAQRIKACKSEDLQPGQMMSVKVGEADHALALYNVNGKFFATGGKCSHVGAPLSWGYLMDKEVYCPFHLARFEVTSGEKVTSPANQGIPSYPVILEGGEVFIEVPEGVNDPSAYINSKKLQKPDWSDKRHFVIVGGGASGFTCAETLRREGFMGRITMLTKENWLPYDRTVMSKNFKADMQSALMQPSEFYEEYGIEVKKNCQVTGVNSNEMQVETSTGEVLNFDKLMVGTGASARVPEVYQKYLGCENVFTLRKADDHPKVKQVLSEAENIVIIGGSFLGFEAATSIRKANPDKKVTVVEMDEVPLGRVMGKEIGAQLTELQRVHNNKVLTGKPVESFEVSGNRVQSVKVGNENIKADFVLISTGAQIETSFMPRNLVNYDQSIPVSSLLQTDHPHIYAAGDVASFPVVHSKTTNRIEHWALAQDHGMHAAYNMLGKGIHFSSVPFFWSNQFVNIQYAGVGGGDFTFSEVKNEGDLLKEARITYFYKGERCIGAATCNWPGAVTHLRIAMEKGLIPSKSQLAYGIRYSTIVEDLELVKHCSCS